MLRPSSTSGFLVSVKSDAMTIITQDHPNDIAREIMSFCLSDMFLRGSCRMSITVDDDMEFIDALMVDMAAAKIPASMSPFTPCGRLLIMKYGIIMSGKSNFLLPSSTYMKRP